jgi:hypothetical protein
MTAEDDMHLTWKAMSLDEKGREELANEQEEHRARVEEIEVRSANRIAKSGGPRSSVVFALLGFRRSRNGRPSADSPSIGRRR